MKMSYTQLVNDLYRDDRSNLYETIMGNESKLLKLMDTVSNGEQQKTLERRQFVHSSLADIWQDGSSALRDTFQDLVKAHTLPNIVGAFNQTQRRLYVGLLLIFTALFLIMMQQV